MAPTRAAATTNAIGYSSTGTSDDQSLVPLHRLVILAPLTLPSESEHLPASAEIEIVRY